MRAFRVVGLLSACVVLFVLSFHGVEKYLDANAMLGHGKEVTAMILEKGGVQVRSIGDRNARGYRSGDSTENIEFFVYEFSDEAMLKIRNRWNDKIRKGVGDTLQVIYDPAHPEVNAPKAYYVRDSSLGRLATRALVPALIVYGFFHILSLLSSVGRDDDGG